MDTVEKKATEPRESTPFIAVLKFVPIIVLALLIILAGLEVMVAAAIASLVAGVIVMYTNRWSVNQVVDTLVDGGGSVTVVYFILMLAYCVAEAFMATGVGAAIINIALDLGVTGQTVAPIALVVTAILSVATGSSWGAFAACAPVFLWLGYIADGSSILTICAIAGGSCFGDNIGLISDTTVVSSGLNDVQVVDRMKHQGAWSISCLAVSAIIFYVMSMGFSPVVGSATDAINAIPVEAWEALEAERPSAVLLLNQVRDGVPYYMIIPLLVVIGVALSGVSTMICLAAGIFVSLIFGMISGTMTPDYFLGTMIPSAFADAGCFSVILVLWIAGFGALVSSMNAFEPLANVVLKNSKKVRHLMTWNALLCLLANAAFADEMAEITTTTPITKSLIDNNIVVQNEKQLYSLHLRNATLADALGVYGSQLIPWHCYVVFYVAIANAVYPLQTFSAMDLISQNIMAFVAVGSMLVLTFTGLDRFIPGFKLPSEPDVYLKK